MAEPVRVAIVGCGFFARNHLFSWKDLAPEGVELVEVSMLLGHSELRVTADLYTHLVKQTAAKAATRMDAVLNIGRTGA